MGIHNPNQVLMGTVGSNIREVTNRLGVIAAGIAVRLKSDDTITVAKADGDTIGVSLGKDLSGIGRTAIARKGLRVPIQLTASFNPTIGAVVNISDTTGLAIAAGGGATAFNATYVSGRVGGNGVNGGLQEDGTLVGVAFIDMPGGVYKPMPFQHDPTKVLMGTTTSSDRTVTNEDGDPATFKAGLAVRLSTTGTLQLADDAVAARIGVSLGASLDYTKRTAVCRVGNWVPLKLKDESVKASGTVTITAYANLVSGTDDAITVGGIAFVAQAGAATPGDATFQAATSNNATATSLAAQINAHETASMLVVATVASAVVTLTAVDAGTEGNDITLTYTDNDTNVGATLGGLSGGKLSGGEESFAWLEKGAVVLTDDVTGEGSSDGDPTSATYLSGPLTGVYPDGTTAWVAQIDMGGGL